MIKAILIIINQSFKQGMSKDALYEATRGDWAKINAEKKQADYAVAVAGGVIKAVYHIEKWEAASGNRQRFTGSRANDMEKYIESNVGRKKRGDQDPTYFTDDLQEFVEGGGFQGIKIVEEQHVLQAFVYIRGRGVKEESKGTLSLSERSKAISKTVVHEEILYAVKDTIRIAYLYAIGQKSDEQGDFSEKQIRMFDAKMDHIGDPWQSMRAAARLQKLGFEIRNFNEIKEEVIMSKNSDSYLNLLLQFKQIIFFGPPGTGKTFGAKKLLKELFDDKTEEELESLRKNFMRWDIVQFHPSYNYEDFVRGIQAEITDGGQVSFEARNKTFGEMCERACKKPEEKYALIIDEINRANVSAVLGELIYALEYRDEEIKTSLEVEGNQGLTVPSNLYIIGTMNTADRTIGQIDYAVRRRFAFVHCPPDKDAIEDEEACDFFDRVNKIFDKQYISPDFDEKDVRIGHSYFMASGYELANKIIYQVIPILQEYVKDGVLTELATSSIDKITEDAEELKNRKTDIIKNSYYELKESTPLSGDKNRQQKLLANKGDQWFRWKYKDDNKYTFTEMVGHTARKIITDFINNNLDKDIEYFQKEFKSLEIDSSHPRIVLFEYAKKAYEDTTRKTKKKMYFMDFNYPIKLDNGEVVAISTQWGTTGVSEPQWKEFKNKMAQYDYSIGQCYIVSIGENSRRAWKYCYEFGFVAAGGSQAYHTVMKSLKKGDVVFAYLAGSGVGVLDKGVICYGEVTDEAKLISEFKTVNDKLLVDCEVDEGEKYRDKFPTAFMDPENEYPDMAVGVKWLAEPLQKPFKILHAPQGGSGGYRKNFDENIIMKLQEAFNLSVKELE